MPDTLQSVKQVFKDVVAIYEQTAALLRDTCSLMSQHGYGNAASQDSIGTEQTKKLEMPSGWITPYAARYFIQEATPEVVKAVGVHFAMFDSTWKPMDPLILFGTFRVRTVRPGDSDIPYLWPSTTSMAWHSLVAVRRLREDLACDNYKNDILGGVLRALPLGEVDSTAQLEEKVVIPLLKQVFPVAAPNSD